MSIEPVRMVPETGGGLGVSPSHNLVIFLPSKFLKEYMNFEQTMQLKGYLPGRKDG